MLSGTWRRTVLTAAVGVLFVSAAALVGCQSYEFEPVKPTAFGAVTEKVPITGSKLPPYVMLVVDKSGSMTDPAAGGAACKLNNAYDRSSYTNSSTYTKCRWNELRATFADATNGFVAKNQALANFGLVLYPKGSACQTGQTEVGIGGGADAIIGTINATDPVGGTPTSKSLLAVLSDPKMANPEEGRDRIVMLLTDGAPNCNDANAAICSACINNAAICWDAGQCRPTFAAPCNDPFGGAGCLDEAATVSAVQTLASRGIRTFVIGFGIGNSTDRLVVAARGVLDSAAQAGGLARATSPYFYDVNNRAELEQALADLVKVFSSCTYTLSPAPTDPSLLQVVFVKGEARTESVLSASEWTISGNSLEITGARCAEITNATSSDKLEVQFRYVSGL